MIMVPVGLQSADVSMSPTVISPTGRGRSCRSTPGARLAVSAVLPEPPSLWSTTRARTGHPRVEMCPTTRCGLTIFALSRPREPSEPPVVRHGEGIATGSWRLITRDSLYMTSVPYQYAGWQSSYRAAISPILKAPPQRHNVPDDPSGGSEGRGPVGKSCASLARAPLDRAPDHAGADCPASLDRLVDPTPARRDRAGIPHLRSMDAIVAS